LLAGCGGTKAVTVTRTIGLTTVVAPTTTAACKGRDLGGYFNVVPGSPGAGQISYKLELINASSAACFVTGIPRLQLLGAHGRALPTKVSPARPGQPTVAKILLRPYDFAKAEARFSPDVPGTGEQTQGQCEPTSYRLRVTVGGSSAAVPITPPNPVCEHGALSVSMLAAA
jgi:hypothetical protein